MAVTIPFVRDIAFEYGVCEWVSPLIRRVICNNPSGFTFKGTGTYIVGRGKVAVIDPGPLDEAHVAAILKAVEGETVTHILITHTHMDHSPATTPLKAATGNPPAYGFGPHGEGKILAGQSVEAGGDQDFTPDIRVAHGDVIEGDGWTIECVHTPGHTSNHLCFALREEKVLFTGDHVMGWSTSVISPPDGDMRDYMASLDLLLTRDDAVYWPTHGPAITDPHPFVRAFIDHRAERDAQILACLADGIDTIAGMVKRMYADVNPLLHPAAARSVLSHLINLVQQGKVTIADGAAPGPDARYRLG
ncbi:MAG TPA: MBL fold metallo-hydrolase [Alphaproteobacteria bacterium]|nr:MBL fold metallo-hydrolase [Alphaproteobacteria bacterium]